MQDARRTLRGKGPCGYSRRLRGPRTPACLTYPEYQDPASKELWQPVWSGSCVERMEQRGLAETMMIGMFTDHRPQEGGVGFALQ